MTDSVNQNSLSRAAEWLFRRLIDLRFGRGSVESDIITDYLDEDLPDWSGACSAWRTFARQREGCWSLGARFSSRIGLRR